jgi:GNAT superfamily N-acetyltransferase
MHQPRHAIDIARVPPDDTEALLRLYIDLFHDREPLTKWCGLSKERMLEVARSIYLRGDSNPLAQGLCWIARDRSASSQAVGFIVCDDSAAEGHQQVPENVTPAEREKISVMLALLDDVREPVKDRIGSEPGQCLHIAALAVTPGYEGTGIATRLLQTAIADAAARGFVHAFAECTSVASRKCHEKAGFQHLHSVTTGAFGAGDGRRPFSNIHTDIFLLWKEW